MGKEQAQREHAVSSTFKIGSHRASYDACFDAFANSPYGVYQATQQLRFHKRYTYDPQQMLVDLGDDIHPVNHMRWTHDEVAVPLLAAQCEDTDAEQPTVSDVVSVRLAALTHDIGECEHPQIKQDLGRIVGDKLYGTITAEDKAIEKLVRNYVIARIGSPHMLLSNRQIAQLESVVDNVNQDKFADMAFNTCERAGYYGTALRAGEIVLAEGAHVSGLDTDRHQELSRLAVVVSGHRDFLETKRARFPYVDDLLISTRALHNAIHTEIAPALKTTTEVV